MKRLFLTLGCILLAGCVSVPAGDRAIAAILKLHPTKAPMVRYAQIGGQKIMFARDGVAFFEDETVVAIAQLILQRRAQRSWSQISSLTTSGETWRVSLVDNYLLLERLKGGGSKLDRAFIAEDGYIGMDESYRKGLEVIDKMLQGVER